MFSNRSSFLLVFLVLCLIHSNDGQNYTCDPNLSCGCSLASISVTAKIVGGEAAANNAWGWAAQLIKFGRFSCTAVLISNSYALTAAHCTLNITKPSDLSVIAGTNSLQNSNGAGQQRTVIEYYVHPNFNSGQSTSDIAVLRFAPLTDSSTIKFICLPSAGADPYALGSNVIVAGWGVLNENTRNPSPLLQHVTVQILPSGSYPCQRGSIIDASVQTCAGVATGGKDACFGDSGGPLMIFTDSRWVLGGITSSGVGCARVGYAAIYTRVSVFVTFIENVITFGNTNSGSQTTASSQNSGSPTVASDGVAISSHFYFHQILFFLVILFIQINL